MTFSERRISIKSGRLALEGMLHEDPGDLALLMLHPHPQYGGDMDNHVVTGICGAVVELGASTLRFNFRGAGRSGGAFDGGVGEADDARAAAALLRAEAPGRRFVLAGYSFGAMVAAAVAADVAPDALVLVSPPIRGGALVALPDGVPTLIVGGYADERVPVGALRALEGLARVVVVPGAGHSWWPGLGALLDATTGFVREMSSIAS